jgi:hypothetical protein
MICPCLWSEGGETRQRISGREERGANFGGFARPPHCQQTSCKLHSSRRCLDGRFISLDSTMCGSGHRFQSATLPSIVCPAFVTLKHELTKIANPPISRSIGIGWLSPTACQYKNGTMKRLQNGLSIILPSSPISNGSSLNSRRWWIPLCRGSIIWNTIAGRLCTSRERVLLSRNWSWSMRFICEKTLLC